MSSPLRLALLGHGFIGRMHEQAALACGRAPTADATDWASIARHYASLEALTGSAIVRLNRAVAVAEAHGPRAGLAILTALDDILRDNHRYATVRGELAHRSGDTALALSSYRTALDLCANVAERAHLRARLAAIPFS